MTTPALTVEQVESIREYSGFQTGPEFGQWVELSNTKARHALCDAALAHLRAPDLAPGRQEGELLRGALLHYAIDPCRCEAGSSQHRTCAARVACDAIRALSAAPAASQQSAEDDDMAFRHAIMASVERTESNAASQGNGGGSQSTTHSQECPDHERCLGVAAPAAESAGKGVLAWVCTRDNGKALHFSKLDGWHLDIVQSALSPAPQAEACPVCNGTGQRMVSSFVDPSKNIANSCSVCKGTGMLPNATVPQAEARTEPGLAEELERAIDEARAMGREPVMVPVNYLTLEAAIAALRSRT